MVFLLGVADFGRVFADGIALEAAARNTAEAVAQEYLQLCRKNVTADPKCDLGLQTSDYAALHTLAQTVGCRESERLTNLVPAGGFCPTTNPTFALCIHDDNQGDLGCGQEAPAPGGPCYEMDASWSPTRAAGTARPYAEVRVCYRFDPLFTFAFGNFGTVWLQKANTFAVTNY